MLWYYLLFWMWHCYCFVISNIKWYCYLLPLLFTLIFIILLIFASIIYFLITYYYSFCYLINDSLLLSMLLLNFSLLLCYLVIELPCVYFIHCYSLHCYSRCSLCWMLLLLWRLLFMFFLLFILLFQEMTEANQGNADITPKKMGGVLKISKSGKIFWNSHNFTWNV